MFGGGGAWVPDSSSDICSDLTTDCGGRLQYRYPATQCGIPHTSIPTNTSIPSLVAAYSSQSVSDGPMRGRRAWFYPHRGYQRLLYCGCQQPLSIAYSSIWRQSWRGKLDADAAVAPGPAAGSPFQPRCPAEGRRRFMARPDQTPPLVGTASYGTSRPCPADNEPVAKHRDTDCILRRCTAAPRDLPSQASRPKPSEMACRTTVMPNPSS